MPNKSLFLPTIKKMNAHGIYIKKKSFTATLDCHGDGNISISEFNTQATSSDSFVDGIYLDNPGDIIGRHPLGCFLRVE